jgi:hypothetical protein
MCYKFGAIIKNSKKFYKKFCKKSYTLSLLRHRKPLDWLDDIKCIGLQGRYKKYFADIQIYPDEFSISFDLDEPNDDITYALESKNQLYRMISETISTLK